MFFGGIFLVVLRNNYKVLKMKNIIAALKKRKEHEINLPGGKLTIKKNSHSEEFVDLFFATEDRSNILIGASTDDHFHQFLFSCGITNYNGKFPDEL